MSLNYCACSPAQENEVIADVTHRQWVFTIPCKNIIKSVRLGTGTLYTAEAKLTIKASTCLRRSLGAGREKRGNAKRL